jgi:hypothetical protein
MWQGAMVRRLPRKTIDRSQFSGNTPGPALASIATLCDNVSPAQAAQMHARPRCASGSLLSKAGLNSALVHQQGVSKLPLCATAQAFAPPHSGHSTVRKGRSVGKSI